MTADHLGRVGVFELSEYHLALDYLSKATMLRWGFLTAVDNAIHDTNILSGETSAHHSSAL